MKKTMMILLIVLVFLTGCATDSGQAPSLLTSAGKIVGGIAGDILGFDLSLPKMKATTSQLFNPKRINKIAILIHGNNNVPKRLIEDEFIRAIMEKGYQIPSRSDMAQIMGELDLQRSGITDSDAAKFGKFLNVPAVLIISVTQYDVYKSGKSQKLKASISARLIDVERSDILWIASASKSTIYVDRGNDLLAQMSESIAMTLPSHI